MFADGIIDDMVVQEQPAQEPQVQDQPHDGAAQQEQPAQEEQICPICQDELGDNPQMLSCFHGFHEGCINQWFNTQDQGAFPHGPSPRTCPVCQTEQ